MKGLVGFLGALITGMPLARAAAAANTAGGCSWQAKQPLFLKN